MDAFPSPDLCQQSASFGGRSAANRTSQASDLANRFIRSVFRYFNGLGWPINDSCLILNRSCLILNGPCLILNRSCLILNGSCFILNRSCLI